MTVATQTDFYAAFLHELNQPLTTLRNVLELTTYREANDWPAVIEAALTNVDRMVELLDLMGELSRFERVPATLAAVDIAELLREALEDLGASASMEGRSLTGNGVETPVWVQAALDPLRSALFRVVGDAVHQVRPGQFVDVSLFVAGPDDGGQVTCQITYPEPSFAQNEVDAMLALARTGRGTRGGITRRVFRVGLCLRVLVLQGVIVELSDGNNGDRVLRLRLPAAAAPAIAAT